MKRFLLCCGIIAIIVAAGAGFIYSGIYNIAADKPHTRAVFWVIETLRDRSISRHANNIRSPNLDNSALLISGGPDYAEMCEGCHSKPGSTDSEIRESLYPRPPNLAQPSRRSPEEMFWIIKHGIKMTAMPAWGKTHDDNRMWAMVAFIRKLPRLTPTQYQILTARRVESDDGSAHAEGTNPGEQHSH